MECLRLSHVVGEARAPAARPERSGEGSGRPNRADEAYRDSGGPLCDRAAARSRLPHFVRETKKRDATIRAGSWKLPRRGKPNISMGQERGFWVLGGLRPRDVWSVGQESSTALSSCS